MVHYKRGRAQRSKLDFVKVLLLLTTLFALSPSLETALAQHSDHPPGDPRATEHEQFLNLAPDGFATRRAVASGNWSDATIWSPASLPNANSRVQIPPGITVTFDMPSTPSIMIIRVDQNATLRFSNVVNTMLLVDTLVVLPDGTLEIGTSQNPIPATITTQIVIADNGPLDRTWDPAQLSRGIVSHGKVSIYGAAKSALHKCKAVAVGEVKIEVSEEPVGWKAGDTIIITGTRYLGDKWNGSAMVWNGSDDEEVVIKSISGKLIEITTPLLHNHLTPQADLLPSVGNASRNIVFTSENFQSLPNNQRGHTMFMHSNVVDVRYALFKGLGRTDKMKALDDFQLIDGSRAKDSDGKDIPGPSNNKRGRYPLHFHRIGTDYGSSPAVAVGNVIWNSPGWAAVHHDSYAIFEDNFVYDFRGSGFVAETGNETGIWKHNLAIKGDGQSVGVKSGDKNHDVGKNGTGFWFQGRLIGTEGNVAAGMKGHGYAYFMRGVDDLPVPADNPTYSEAAKFENPVGVEINPIDDFTDNEAFAVGTGLEVHKANPDQMSDSRSDIRRFTGWNCEHGI